MQQTNPQTIQYVITALVIGVVLFLRFRTMKRARRLRLETLWIVPAIIALALAIGCYEAPPAGPLGWLWLALALAVGAGIGWWRGKLMRITVDPATHMLNQQSSPAALLFIIVLIVARQGLRYEAAAMGVNILKLTGILMASMLGVIGAARAEMFIRARRMLAQVRAAG